MLASTKFLRRHPCEPARRASPPSSGKLPFCKTRLPLFFEHYCNCLLWLANARENPKMP